LARRDIRVTPAPLYFLITIMSHRSDVSVESICTVKSCTSDEFLEFYENENLDTDILSEDVMINVIHPNRDRLRAVDGRYRLDKLLSAMLEYAPHPLGRRYVAIALHIAMGKGGDAVVEAAKAWMDYLFLPSQVPQSLSLTFTNP